MCVCMCMYVYVCASPISLHYIHHSFAFSQQHYFISKIFATQMIEPIDELFLEGIKERLEDLAEEDMHHAYGLLLAKEALAFDPECISDSAKLAKLVGAHKKTAKNAYDW